MDMISIERQIYSQICYKAKSEMINKVLDKVKKNIYNETKVVLGR